MKCLYCEQHLHSAARMENNQRFCRIKQGLVFEDSAICEGYEPAETFWCDNTSCWLDFKICVNRQYKEADECKKCPQKRDLLELRRVVGRQSQSVKKIIRRAAA